MLLSVRDPYCLYLHRDNALPDLRELYPTVRIICFGDAQCHGDSHPFIDSDQFLRQLYMNVMGQNVRGAKAYERVADCAYIRSGTVIDGSEILRTLMRTIQRKYVILPLMRNNDMTIVASADAAFPLPDHHVGWVYAEIDAMLQKFDLMAFNAASRRVINQYLRMVVEQDNLILSGKCYGYELYHCGRYMGGEAGMLGEVETILKQIETALPAYCAGMTKHFEKC